MESMFPFDEFLNLSTKQKSIKDDLASIPTKNEAILTSQVPPENTKTPKLKNQKSDSKGQTKEERISFTESSSISVSSIKEISLIFFNELKNLVGPEKFKAYFENSLAIKEIKNETIHLIASSTFVKTMISTHYQGTIQESIHNISEDFKNYTYTLETSETTNSTTIKEQFNKNSFLAPLKKLKPSPYSNLSVENLAEENSLRPKNIKESKFSIDLVPSTEDLQNKVDSVVIAHLKEGEIRGNFINPKKIFENFIVGPSNNMAYASAIAVSKNPGKVYPSLYFHGASGLGKTHLLHAVANEIIKNFPYLRICFTTARDFMTEMVDAMANRKISSFRKKYSESVDLLMIDDIHDLKDKTGTQNELFHIFNELYNKGKQLIFTSDKAPSEIDGLEERIKTRLSWGLVLDIQRPDMETRTAILKKKAIEEDIYVPEDVVYLVASSIKNNIRELEGSLIRLGAYSSVMKVDIDIEMAKEQLKDLLSENSLSPSNSIEIVARKISDYFKVPMADLKSKARQKDITEARHVAMYLSYKVIHKTLSEIGRFFSNRDHSSVLHAVDKIKKRMKNDQEFLKCIKELENRIKKI